MFPLVVKLALFIGTVYEPTICSPVLFTFSMKCFLHLVFFVPASNRPRGQRASAPSNDATRHRHSEACGAAGNPWGAPGSWLMREKT